MLSRRTTLHSSKTFLYRPWVGRASPLLPIPPSLRCRERQIWWKMQKENYRRIAEEHKMCKEIRRLNVETCKILGEMNEDHRKNRKMYRTYPFLPLMPFIWFAVTLIVWAAMPNSSDVEEWKKSVASVASQEKETQQEEKILWLDMGPVWEGLSSKA